MKTAIRAAIVGMGGFARQHHGALRRLEAEGDCRLVATCDLHPEQFTASQSEWEFARRGVRVYSDYLEMLDAHRDELDFVTLPTPVPLHAPMHREVINRGLACYLEKPPTLSWRELEAMIEAERSAAHLTQVGFNFIAEQPRQALKRRLLSGEFGSVRRAGFVGYWPRATSYFTRAPWAGRLMMNDRLVLDSCTGNAMAHFIHNLLFWCGSGELLSWGEVREVEAELYRAHAIESFDTVFARGRCENGIEVLVAATHAGSGASHHREWVECEHATLTYRTGQNYEIRWTDGRTEDGPAERADLLVENLRQYARYLRGEESRPLTRLQDARPFVHFNALLLVASGHIATISEAHLQRTTTPGGEWLTIQNIEAALDAFAHNGRLPGEAGLAWRQRGGRAILSDLEQLEPVVQRMEKQTYCPST